MKTIKVVAAVIRDGGRVFATQRGYGDYKDGWEFPGGKIEAGETPQIALAREIREELDAEIIVGEHLVTVEHDYPNFHLSMKCFWAKLADGARLKLLEHEAAKWLTVDELDSVDWLPADIAVVNAIKASNLQTEITSFYGRKDSQTVSCISCCSQSLHQVYFEESRSGYMLP